MSDAPEFATGFDFVRSLANPVFRAWLRAIGHTGDTRVLPAVESTTVASLLERMDGPGRYLLAARLPDTWELLWIDVPLHESPWVQWTQPATPELIANPVTGDPLGVVVSEETARTNKIIGNRSDTP